MLLLIPFLVLVVTGKSYAQNQVNILQADRIEGGQVNGEQVQKIIGDVYLKMAEENIEMYCDSAWQFINKSEIRAFGNIEINTEQEKIWADTLIYFTDVDFARMRGHVIIEADSTTLFGNSVDYRFSTKVGHFIDEIRLEDPEGVLRANSGYYYRQADSAVFRGQVQLRDSLQYLEGDSLFSNRKSKYYEMYGDIFADNRENNTTLKGDYLEADSTGRRLLEGNAWLRNVDRPDTTETPENQADTLTTTPDSPARGFQPDTLAARTDTARQDTSASEETQEARSDTTHIRASRILSIEERTPSDTANIVNAYGNVRIWSPRYSAVADTSRYNEHTDTFELWSQPKTWHENTQLSGPYIRVVLEEGNIRRLVSYPEPFAVQKDTAINRLNQMTGDTLTAYFDEGSLTQIYLQGNTHLLQYTKNEQGEADGANDMTASVTRIYFEDGELTRLKSLGPIQGSYLPESPQTAERRLEGFIWTPELRPQRPARQMEPRFPPIPDERPFELPRRYKTYIETSSN